MIIGAMRTDVGKGTFASSVCCHGREGNIAMTRSITVAVAVLFTTVLFGYVGAALLATEAGRMILGTVAGMLMLATVAACAGFILSRGGNYYAAQR